MLTELTLRNFKAFAEVTIPLRQLTLLTGLNSSGKSSVLQALALLRQTQSIGGKRAWALNGELVELGTGRDVRHEAWIDGVVESGAIEIGVRHPLGKLNVSSEFRPGDPAETLWSATYQADEDLLHLHPPRMSLLTDDGWQVWSSRDRFGGLSDDHFSPIPEPIPGVHVDGGAFQYLRADRISPAVSYLRSTAVQNGFLGARGEHSVNYLRIHQDDEVPSELRHADAVSNTLLRQVEAWLGLLCPGINLRAAGIDGTDTVRLSFSHGSAGLSSSNQYRPTNVGFGLTYALPIVIACLTAKPGALILLENPEAHLHPRGQTAMAELIARAASTGAQFVVESHSDHVLNGLRLAVKRAVLSANELQLLYFHADDRGTKQVDAIEVRPSGAVDHWPAGFFDEWDNALDELID